MAVTKTVVNEDIDSGNWHLKATRTKTSAAVCDLVFIIPLQAARRAMAAVVGFSIYQKNPGRPA